MRTNISSALCWTDGSACIKGKFRDLWPFPGAQQPVGTATAPTAPICLELWRPIIDTNKVSFIQLVNQSRSWNWGNMRPCKWLTRQNCFAKCFWAQERDFSGLRVEMRRSTGDPLVRLFDILRHVAVQIFTDRTVTTKSRAAKVGTNSPLFSCGSHGPVSLSRPSQQSDSTVVTVI